MTHIKALRQSLGLSQAQLAEQLGYHPNTIAQLERGELPMTKRLAKALAHLRKEKIMFFIIETEYVGPNSADQRYADEHYYEIATMPGRTNLSGEEREHGWLGRTNDWDRRAHGAFATLEDAKDALESLLEGDYRDASDELEGWDKREYGIVLRYRDGSYPRCGDEATRAWVYEGIRADVTGPMSDAEIEALVEHYLELGKQEGSVLLDAAAIRKEIADCLSRVEK